MDKQQVLNQLRNAKEIYVIMSLCTKMPYVVCDKETFDDEVLLYFKEEDIRREGKRLIEQGGITVNDDKITDVFAAVERAAFDGEVILKKGKKIFKKLIVE